MDDEDALDKLLGEFGFGSRHAAIDDRTGARWDDVDELSGEGWRPRNAERDEDEEH